MHPAYLWIVEHSDGTFVPEYDGLRIDQLASGRLQITYPTIVKDSNPWTGKVDFSKVRSVILVPTSEERRTHQVFIDPSIGMKPIFFRRVEKIVNQDENSLKVIGERFIHCIGWEMRINGMKIASYNFVFDDGSVIVTNKRNFLD